VKVINMKLDGEIGCNEMAEGEWSSRCDIGVI